MGSVADVRNDHNLLLESLKGIEHSEDLGANGRTIVK
jgi:hypothetical protein